MIPRLPHYRRANTGSTTEEETSDSFIIKYYPVSSRNIQSRWETLYKRTKDMCIHGRQCEYGTLCSS